MRKLFILAAIALTGCSTIQSWIPSFWDDNQSRSIITARQQIENIDCALPQQPQVLAIHRELQWFTMYSESKGALQRDVMRLTEPMTETTGAWLKRGEGSTAYCELKKRVLTQQAHRAAAAVLGRY